MRTILAVIILFSCQLLAEPKKFGANLTGTATPLKLNRVDKQDVKPNKLFVVEGKVEQVCEKKGCWMTINDGTSSVMVRFKDYGFFVPMKLKGQKIKAEGVFVKKERSIADLKHFAKDSGASEAEITKITKSKTSYEFVAHGVETMGS